MLFFLIQFQDTEIPSYYALIHISQFLFSFSFLSSGLALLSFIYDMLISDSTYQLSIVILNHVLNYDAAQSSTNINTQMPIC